MNKTLIKFLSRDDIKKALSENDLKYCYDCLEEFEETNLIYGEVMPKFTDLILDVDVDPLLYLDKVYSCQYLEIPLTNINIPNNIKKIEWRAFKDTLLTSITIPGSVKSIGSYAFYNCTNLKSVMINDGVEVINLAAFQGCDKLKKVTIGNNVESIGSNAFSRCTRMTSLIMGNSVMSIGIGAFSDCIGLKNVTIPERFKNSLPEIFSDNYSSINFTFI